MGFLINFCCENTFRVYKRLKNALRCRSPFDSLRWRRSKRKELEKSSRCSWYWFDDEKAKIVVEQLKGKSIDELLAEGSTKLASMPAGGGGSAGGAAPAAAAGGDAPAAAKEEKKEEPEEESDDDMGFGLFD